MELFGIAVMLAAGGAVAMLVLVARMVTGEKPQIRVGAPAAAPDRHGIAASLLFHVLVAGGVSPDDAIRDIRRSAGPAAGVTRGIDVTNWAERYAQFASLQQRQALLETAVRLAVLRGTAVPLLQYVALLDLSFSLGFHTSALANLREQYGFDYIDHARDARPRDADRAGRTTFFARTGPDSVAMLRILELGGRPTRQAIISAYRRLATQHHPDRFHDQPLEAQNAAAARFIEITRAYEVLMTTYGD